MSVIAILLHCYAAIAASPGPIVATVFPAGCQAGRSVDLLLTGTALDDLLSVRCNAVGVTSEVLGADRIRLMVPAETVPGCYDLWVAGLRGLSPPRTFVISSRSEQNETEPNQRSNEAQSIALNSIINGRIDSPGDVDYFRFSAVSGQRIVFDCAAERIDSRLRAVLEILDEQGRQLAVNRGYAGIDPLLVFDVPTDGSYLVRIQDLTFTASAEHLYRLDVDAMPRVAFARPDVIQCGTTADIELFGWNLDPSAGDPNTGLKRSGDRFDRIITSVSAPMHSSSSQTFADRSTSPKTFQCKPAQAVSDSFAWEFPGSHAATTFGLTDVPVVLDSADNHSHEHAQLLHPHCMVSGQLTAINEQDWYALEARSGEVFFIEAIAQRVQSPVDLELSVLDARSGKELTQWSDETRGIGGRMLPTSHLDPGGRWVAPDDGRFLINVRNIGGGASEDPRRIYRLSVRREEPALQLVAIPSRDGFGRINLNLGGREILDVVALRQRGLDGAIRISALDLPPGVECPDVWLGPGVDRTTIVISANQGATKAIGELQLIGTAEEVERIADIRVQYATTVREGTPTSWSRLTSQLPLAIVGDAPVRITANGHESVEHHIYGSLKVQHSPGGVLDVAVQIDRRDTSHQAAVRLSGLGLPEMICNETALIPAGQQKGYLSFRLPPTLLPGRYSLAIQAETTVPTDDQKTEAVVVYSDSVAFDVKPAAFLVTVDPFAPRTVRRGETFQVGYASRRQNGFIGKMHTEIAVPGIITDVPGLLGRGETFTGQTEQGALQIVVSDDARLGPQQSLRLFTVGVVEDQPVYFNSCFLPLEVVE